MNPLATAAHLVLGSCCAGCRDPGRLLCGSCRALLELQVPHVARERGLPFPVVAANPYRPLVARLVPRYKDEGALLLEPVLVRRLVRALDVLDPPEVQLVPVPSLPGAVRRRGMDHGRRLTRGAARATGQSMRPLLRRVAGERRQRSLGRTGRELNVDDTMRGRPARGPVVLCDDVLTTGATLREAARALAAVGVQVVGAVVIGDADNAS